MIFDAELMLFWRRLASKRQYIRCIEYRHLSMEDGRCKFSLNDNWAGRVSQFNVRADAIQKNILDLKKEVDKIKQCFKNEN